MTKPERAPHPDDWKPHAGPQTRFLSLTCFEALTGGSAGGGKTDMLLVDASRNVGKGYGRGFTGVLFRRTHPELEKHVIPRSQDLYTRLGGRFNANESVWTFPAGERVFLSHMQHDKDKLKWQGAEIQWAGFDELTQFHESQYSYITSRMRSSHGIRSRLRASTNPGGPGHEWVFKRFAPWLDPNHEGGRLPTGTVRYTRLVGDVELDAVKGEPGAIGRCFVRCGLDDNPSLANDDEYRLMLDRLDPVTRAQLRDGDWLAKPAAGNYFKRAHVKRWLTERPRDTVATVRAWDLAATVDGDWTVGVLMARLGDGTFAVLDVVRLRGAPAEVQATILATAAIDGRAVPIRLPQDPGQAGVEQRANYARMLSGYRVEFERPTGDKITRAGAFSTQWTEGNVACLLARWTDAYVGELEGFPDASHDDQIDASADAFNWLATTPKKITTTPSSVARRSMDGW